MGSSTRKLKKAWRSVIFFSFPDSGQDLWIARNMLHRTYLRKHEAFISAARLLHDKGGEKAATRHMYSFHHASII